MHKHLHGAGFWLSTLFLVRIGPASRLEETVEEAMGVFGVAFAWDLSRLLFWGAGGA